MEKRDKKGNSVINALRCLNKFSETEIQTFELALKQPEQRSKFLKDFHIHIKKGQLIKRINLNKIIFEVQRIINCVDLKILAYLEQEVSLEIKKDNLFKAINDKEIPVSKQMLEKISLSSSINELNGIIESFPNNIKVELGKFKFRRSEPDFSSIIPLYTPMGNKR